MGLFLSSISQIPNNEFELREAYSTEWVQDLSGRIRHAANEQWGYRGYKANALNLGVPANTDYCTPPIVSADTNKEPLLTPYTGKHIFLQNKSATV